MSNAKLIAFLRRFARHLEDPKHLERRVFFNTALDELRDDEADRADAVEQLNALVARFDSSDVADGPRTDFLREVADLWRGPKAAHATPVSTPSADRHDELDPRSAFLRDVADWWKSPPRVWKR